MNGVFISYRRADTQGVAGRLFDALAHRYGAETVFMDVDSLAAGSDFEIAIKETVSRSRIQLALIGPKWLKAADIDGKLRLDNANDLVRAEISSALSSPDTTVIPVLVDEAHMPKAESLPEELRPLTKLNAVQLRHERFGADLADLLSQLDEMLGIKSRHRRAVLTRSIIGALLVTACFTVAMRYPYLWNGVQRKGTSLEIFDASISNGVLDLKLRNVGSDSIVIHEGWLMLDEGRRDLAPCGTPLRPSEVYSYPFHVIHGDSSISPQYSRSSNQVSGRLKHLLKLNGIYSETVSSGLVEGSPFIWANAPIKLSQFIQPEGVDRILIKLESKDGFPVIGGLCSGGDIFGARFVLVYNKDHVAVTSPLRFAIETLIPDERSRE